MVPRVKHSSNNKHNVSFLLTLTLVALFSETPEKKKTIYYICDMK